MIRHSDDIVSFGTLKSLSINIIFSGIMDQGMCRLVSQNLSGTKHNY
jgi:hypothetical protein